MTHLLGNARICLADALVHGAVAIEGGLIAALRPGDALPRDAIDCAGDYLLPGVVDLHTDNLERQVEPRAGARWPGRSAFLAHDAQCAASGITTVLDALCLGDLGFDENRQQTCLDGIADLDALAPTGLLKAEHYLHLRCELPAMGMLAQLDRLAGHPALRMVSLMDHTPGTGQYGDIERYRRMRARDGEAPAETERRIATLHTKQAALRDHHRHGLLARLRGARPVVASHDDRTKAEIAENQRDGITISEFPVTVEAAEAARLAGMGIIAGAPNLVRGGSHSGNVAVMDLARLGLVDALASDYVPSSLIEAAFLLARATEAGLPASVRLISATPARMAGFADRGQILPGLRADLVRVRVHDGVPVIRAVYRAGERVA